MKLLCYFAASLWIAAAQAAPPAKPAWEAALPAGRETDPLALNKTAGVTNRAALDQVKGAQGELKPQSFPELKPRTAGAELFRVLLKTEGVVLPPDMAGTGPFFLVKAEGKYHLLTRRNFATLYGPLKSKEEVVPFVTVFEKIFMNPFAEVITSPTNVKGFKKVPPPAVTEVTEAAAGWDVRVILFSAHRVQAFYEERLRIESDGMVEVKEKMRVIKELGPGYMF